MLRPGVFKSFRKVLRTPGENFRFLTLLAGSTTNLDVWFRWKFSPASLPPIQLLCGHKMFQILMISIDPPRIMDDPERRLKLPVSTFRALYNSQEFLVIDHVIAFGRWHIFWKVGHRVNDRDCARWSVSSSWGDPMVCRDRSVRKTAGDPAARSDRLIKKSAGDSVRCSLLLGFWSATSPLLKRLFLSFFDIVWEPSSYRWVG